MDVDPLASMRCWAIDVEIGGRDYTVPALPAADWWPVLITADPSRIMDLIESSDLDDRLADGEVTGEDLGAALMDVIEEVAGRSFHAAFVLATVASNHWPVINGQLAQRGFRWDVMPLGAALDAVYSLVVGVMEKEARDKFLALLDNETLTTGKRSERQREKVMSEFEAMAGPRPTGGVRSTGAQSDSARSRTRQPRLPHPQDAPSAAPRQPRGPRAGNGPPASS